MVRRTRKALPASLPFVRRLTWRESLILQHGGETLHRPLNEIIREGGIPE
jgi:hypothetical protein